jgi:hypothetical protein
MRAFYNEYLFAIMIQMLNKGAFKRIDLNSLQWDKTDAGFLKMFASFLKASVHF